MKFRKDIQEIRAVAILLVFFYRLSSNHVPGGFIGVDIFFVISGYLISSILLYSNKSRLEKIYVFYGKRVKRLFPSSFICLMCYFHYHPTLFKYSLQETQFYFDIISALLCFSNIRFYRKTLSYFQNEKKSILINYWSLSLEEQFYFLLPLCLCICNNYAFIIFALLSFIYCILSTFNNDSSSYFLLQSRAWELLLGLFIIKSNIILKINSKNILFIIILSSYLIGIYPILKFPGFIAIIPTFLTSLLLIQNNNNIFKSNALELIGNMSYVMYLFHYPIIQNNKSFYITILKISVISYSIYYFIEIPIKKSNKIINIVIICFLLLLLFLQRVYLSINNNTKYYKEKINNTNCKSKVQYLYTVIQNLDNISVLLIGDSHLEHYLPILIPILDKYKAGKVLILKAWIINIEKNYVSISNIILDMNKLLLCIISLYVEYRFLYVEKNRFEKGFKYLVKKIAAVSEGIIIFQDNPHRVSKNHTRCEKFLLPIFISRRIKYIDIFEKYCEGKNECLQNIYSNAIFRDYHHLDEAFVCTSTLIYNLINSAINFFLVYKNKNNNIFIVMNLKYKNEYNTPIIKNYCIKTIKKKIKHNEFGFSELPYFSDEYCKACTYHANRT